VLALLLPVCNFAATSAATPINETKEVRQGNENWITAGKYSEKEWVMKLSRIAAAAATTAAAIAIVSGVAGTTHDTAIPVTLTSDAHPAIAATTVSHLDPSLKWLVSRGGQAQVTFNNEVGVMAADLLTESRDDSVANHLIFEADARVVRAEAQKILRTRALLPTHNRAAYKTMLKDFITVANLLQPGPGYGTTAQDYTAWNTALRASNIIVW
jgi:hypothetical protein